MSSTKTNNDIKISAPMNREFIGHIGGETGTAYYTYTDALGCKHLAGQQWGDWYRVDPSDIMTECARCAAIYASEITMFETSGQPLCTYEYVYGRLGSYQRMFDAVSKEFP